MTPPAVGAAKTVHTYSRSQEMAGSLAASDAKL